MLEPMPAAAFFDLDKTIIAKSSTLAFSRPFQAGGLISRRAVLRSAYAQFMYLVGGADHDQMEKLRQFMSQLCAGWDVQTVRDIVAETLHDIVDPLVYEEAVDLISLHQLAGRRLYVLQADAGAAPARRAWTATKTTRWCSPSTTPPSPAPPSCSACRCT